MRQADPDPNPSGPRIPNDLSIRSPLLLAGAAALCACTGRASTAGDSGGASGNQPSWPTPTSPDSAAFPSGFWQPAGAIPVAKNVMTFVFLNRTGGKLDDGEIFWRFQNDKIAVNELHSFSAQPTYDMPANGSGRMYFYLCGAATQHEACATDPTKSPYYDFIEFTIGGRAGQSPRFNGNTNRVDAFGLNESPCAWSAPPTTASTRPSVRTPRCSRRTAPRRSSASRTRSPPSSRASPTRPTASSSRAPAASARAGSARPTTTRTSRRSGPPTA